MSFDFFPKLFTNPVDQITAVAFLRQILINIYKFKHDINYEFLFHVKRYVLQFIYDKKQNKKEKPTKQKSEKLQTIRDKAASDLSLALSLQDKKLFFLLKSSTIFCIFCLIFAGLHHQQHATEFTLHLSAILYNFLLFFLFCFIVYGLGLKKRL